MSIKKIVDGGYCIGCGLCIDKLEKPAEIKFDKFGQYQLTPINAHTLDDSEKSQAMDICPFSNEGPNEDVIGKNDYDNLKHDIRLGYYKDLYVTHVNDIVQRKNSTSGGIITFVAKQLLIAKHVDYVIHVKKNKSKESDALFVYGVSSTINELDENTKSRYYPIEMSKVIKVMRDVPGKYLVIGLPCFIKGVKRLAASDPLIKERLKFTIGLVCGHLKSKSLSELYAVQCDIAPDKIDNIDFRVKNETGKAIQYSVLVEGNRKSVTKKWKDFFGAHWGYNFFRYSACDYCDDVFAETADITVGDAWLDDYIDDAMGNSVVVVRNKTIADILKTGNLNNNLTSNEVGANIIAKSQSGGLRDRRSGLAYRLYLKQLKGKWVPQKRVEPTPGDLKFFRKQILKNRIVLRKMSHKYWLIAKESKDFNYFKKKMTFYIYKNTLLYVFSNNLFDVIRSIKRMF